MAKKNPLTFVTKERVVALERLTRSLEAAEKLLTVALDQRSFARPSVLIRLPRVLNSTGRILSEIEPGITGFGWTGTILRCAREEADRSKDYLSNPLWSRPPPWRLYIVRDSLRGTILYLRRLIEMMPPHVALAEETKRLQRPAILRLSQLPRRDRLRFYVWTAVGAYSIGSLVTTYAAFWVPALWGLPSFILPVKLTAAGLEVLPGVLPAQLSFAPILVLIGIAYVGGRAVYGEMRILLELAKIEVGFRDRQSEMIHDLQRRADDQLRDTLRKWPDNFWDRHR